MDLENLETSSRGQVERRNTTRMSEIEPFGQMQHLFCPGHEKVTSLFIKNPSGMLFQA
jgi:hypothetical protein